MKTKEKYFIIPYVVVVLFIVVLLYNFNRTDLHLILTEHRTSFTDYFFKYWTEFGGNIPFIVIGLLFFYRYSTALYLLSAQVVGSIFSVTFKHIFSTPRPSLYFRQYFPDLHLPKVEGVHLHTMNSMPSGHTITAFAFFFGIALISKNKYVSLLSFVMAFLVGYSRIYLSQHFADDVLVGSIIGVFCALICFPLYKKWDEKLQTSSLSNVFRRKNKDLVEK